MFVVPGMGHLGFGHRCCLPFQIFFSSAQIVSTIAVFGLFEKRKVPKTQLPRNAVLHSGQLQDGGREMLI